MEEFKTIKEQKELVLRITQEVIPSADLRRSRNLLKIFRERHFPLMGIREISEKVIKEPQEFKNFCETLILKVNKLEESDFNHLLNQVVKLNLEQIEILLNRVLLAKTGVLQLIDKYKRAIKES